MRADRLLGQGKACCGVDVTLRYIAVNGPFRLGPIPDWQLKIGWLAEDGLAGWEYRGCRKTQRQWLNLHLALQPVLDSDFLHHVQLRFQPVNMFFGGSVAGRSQDG